MRGSGIAGSLPEATQRVARSGGGNARGRAEHSTSTRVCVYHVPQASNQVSICSQQDPGALRQAPSFCALRVHAASVSFVLWSAHMGDLPAELVVSIARNFASAPPLLGMIATCRGWRAAIQTAHAELWMLVTRRRFTRVARLCELMRQDQDDLDGRALYAAQLRAEKPIKHRSGACGLPFFNDFIFTVELLDADDKLCSWSGVFEGSDPRSFGNHGPPDMCVSNFPVPERHLAWFQAVQDGTLREVPRWSLQIFVTSRSDMASTTKLYDESWRDVDEGPMVLFKNADLPVNHPTIRDGYEQYIEMRPLLEYVSDGVRLQLIVTHSPVDGASTEVVSEPELISALMSCLPSQVYY